MNEGIPVERIPLPELAKNATEQILANVFIYGWQSGYQAGIAQAQRQLNEFLRKEELKYTGIMN